MTLKNGLGRPGRGIEYPLFIKLSIVLTVVLAAFVSWTLWLHNILNTNGFEPHGYCFFWNPGVLVLHVGSDTLIGLSYVAISLTLGYFVYRTRHDIPFQWIFIAFGVFIIACGTTHFMAVWTLWHATYWLSGTIKLITAIASVATALAFPPLIPKVFALIETAKVSEERKRQLEIAHRELEVLYGKTKELDQLKSQFFANVSHELRTPLTLILGPVRNLLTESNLTQKQYHDLEIVERNGMTLLKHVNDLLDIAKLEAGQMIANYANVDVVHLLQLCIAHFEMLAQERQLTLSTDIPESLYAQVDPEKIQRILLNLLSNAFKFTPIGGTIHCALSKEEDHFTFVIQDSGPGVKPELREAIFERFRQGEGDLTRRLGGTGLGLAIVKEFTELHGGTISVGDASASGAVFTVDLPLHAPSSASIASCNEQNSEEAIAETLAELLPIPDKKADTVPLQAIGTTQPLVLIVEDNREMSSFIADTLSGEYRIVTAFDGKDGLQKALALGPDLVLCDIMMPAMTGDQLVHQLRIHPELDSTPIVMLSAKSDEIQRVELLREGAQDYLMKPFFPEELRVRVANLLMMRQVRQLLQREVTIQSQNLVGLTNEVIQHQRELSQALSTLQDREVRLQDQTKELEHTNCELHQQRDNLLVLNTALAEANRMRSQILSTMSHELRTPLTSIIGFSKLLLNNTAELGPRQQANLERILKNGQHLLDLINGVLHLVEIEAGRMEISLTQVDVRALLTSVVDQMQSMAASHCLVLRTEVQEGLEALESDAEKLRQILLNLVSNALKYTEQGEVTVSATRVGADRIAFAVRDTGIGISAEIQERIFEAFYQAEGGYTRKYGGTGLGLAIAQQLTTLLGGKIEVTSAPGQGSTFTVVLPIKAVHHQ